jgi:hypothetical protein
MEVQTGSVIIKIYRVENKGRESFTVSYHADGRRKLQMFASFEEAHAEAKSKATALSRGELDAMELRSVDGGGHECGFERGRESSRQRPHSLFVAKLKSAWAQP